MYFCPNEPHYFDTKNSAVLRARNIHFEMHKLFYSDLSGLTRNQVEQSVSLAVLICSIKNLTFRLEVEDGWNHFKLVGIS